MTHAGATGPQPRVLVFTTNGISDMAVDLAGSSHMDYSSHVQVIPVPCSGGINPQWILHAVKAGYDGVFVAADGPECSYLTDCTERTAAVITQAQALLQKEGLDPKRVKMAALCSVCAEPFVNHMKQFGKALAELAPSRAPAAVAAEA